MKRFALILAVFLLLCGCSRTGGEITVTENTPSFIPAQEAVPSTEAAQTEPEEEPFDLARLKFHAFSFSSGAGGWRTVLTIRSDGSFTGTYTASDPETGTDFPRGTLHYCRFSGQFSQPRKVNGFTYSMTLEDLTYAHQTDEAPQIIDGIRYLWTDAFGMEGTEEFLLYLPDAPVEELPEEFWDWVRGHSQDLDAQTLPFYGLYNTGFQAGFSGQDMVPFLHDAAAAAELEAEALDKTIYNDPNATQTDMNVASRDKYLLWDNLLNQIWEVLKANLEENTMEALLAEQRVWIQNKEAALEAAREEAGGGSIAGLSVGALAADYTRERVYVLLDHLK